MYFSFPFLTYLSGCYYRVYYKAIAVLILLKHTDNAQMSLSENEAGYIQYCVCLGNVICLEPWKVWLEAVLNNIMQNTDMSVGRMWSPLIAGWCSLPPGPWVSSAVNPEGGNLGAWKTSHFCEYCKEKPQTDVPPFSAQKYPHWK